MPVRIPPKVNRFLDVAGRFHSWASFAAAGAALLVSASFALPITALTFAALNAMSAVLAGFCVAQVYGCRLEQTKEQLDESERKRGALGHELTRLKAVKTAAEATAQLPTIRDADGRWAPR